MNTHLDIWVADHSAHVFNIKVTTIDNLDQKQLSLEFILKGELHLSTNLTWCANNSRIQLLEQTL